MWNTVTKGSQSVRRLEGRAADRCLNTAECTGGVQRASDSAKERRRCRRGAEKPLWVLILVDGPEKGQAAWTPVCLGHLFLSGDLTDTSEPLKVLSSSLDKLRLRTVQSSLSI